VLAGGVVGSEMGTATCATAGRAAKRTGRKRDRIIALILTLQDREERR
jgi:hypothetical protein